jgi:hypothetical protein
VKHWSGPEVVCPGLVPDPALYAPVNVAQATATWAEKDAERTKGETPVRLDEALKYAVARIEKDPRNVEAIIHYLGWDGHFAEADLRVDQPVDLARERAKQIANRAIERLREEGFVPDAVERSIALIERSVPIIDVELCEALLNAKLSFIKFSCHALLAVVQAFRENSPLEVVKLNRSFALAKPDTIDGLNQLAARAQSLMLSRGCANMMDLTDEARVTFGPYVSQRLTEAVVRTVGRFEWLDQEKGWFWYIPDRLQCSNRLVNQIQQMLAATPRIQLATLRSAIRHHDGLGGFAPPLNVLASICRRLLFVQMDGDTAVRAPGLARWNDVLSPNEKIFADVLQSHGPALGREEFLEHCRKRGMNEDTFNQFTSRSAVLQTVGPSTYALVGATLPAAPTEDIGAEANRDVSASTHHGFLSDGQVFLAWKLQLATLQGGVLRVPEPMNTFLEGDYKLKTVANRELGLLHFCQRACWDVRRLLRDRGGDAADTLVIVLSLQDQRAIGFLGDDDVVASLTAAGDGLPMAGSNADTDQKAGEHSGFHAA